MVWIQEAVHFDMGMKEFPLLHRQYLNQLKWYKTFSPLPVSQHLFNNLDYFPSVYKHYKLTFKKFTLDL